MIRLALPLALLWSLAFTAVPAPAASVHPCDYYGFEDGDVRDKKCCNPEGECRKLVESKGGGNCQASKADPAKECAQQKSEYACVQKAQCSWRAYKPAGESRPGSTDAERH